jgi:DNA polymerase IIIc chi subunit
LERLLDESFVAHGRARDGDSALQPVYLTVGLENPNGAALRLFVEGAQMAMSSSIPIQKIRNCASNKEISRRSLAGSATTH